MRQRYLRVVWPQILSVIVLEKTGFHQLDGLVGVLCVSYHCVSMCRPTLCSFVCIQWELVLKITYWFLSDFFFFFFRVEASRNAGVVFKMPCLIFQLAPSEVQLGVLKICSSLYRKKRTFQKRIVLIKCSQDFQARYRHIVSVSAVFMLSVQLGLYSRFCSCVHITGRLYQPKDPLKSQAQSQHKACIC